MLDKMYFIELSHIDVDAVLRTCVIDIKKVTEGRITLNNSGSADKLSMYIPSFVQPSKEYTIVNADVCPRMFGRDKRKLLYSWETTLTRLMNKHKKISDNFSFFARSVSL